jgi:hypothetical protein
MTLGGGDLFVILIVFLAILTVLLGVKTVPQGYKSNASAATPGCFSPAST